jgi:hypothetical protein
MKQFILTTTLTIGLLAFPAPADTIYVDGVNGNDAWDGLCETWDGGTCGPKKTIQAGINVAGNGDEVLIADATYSGSGNQNIRFYARTITVRSTGGPENCIIDCLGGTQPAFHFVDGETPASVLDGVTVKNCYGC